MLRGDLETTPLADLLERLAAGSATGVIYVLAATRRSINDEATVSLRNGAICGVTLPGGVDSQDSVGTRLVASHRLSPVDLDDAREAQETELANWMLGELLIHLGLADEQHVRELVTEQALSDLGELCDWPAGSWRFRRRERLGRTLPSPLPVKDAIELVQQRRLEWSALLPVIHGADAVVSLAAGPTDGDYVAEAADEAPTPVEMDADGYALLCAVDGVSTVAGLGATAGFTVLDAARTFSKLVSAGLVQVAGDAAEETELPATAAADPGASNGRLAGDREEGPRSLAAISAALSFPIDDSLIPTDAELGYSNVGAPWQPPRTSGGDPLSDALARVSAALSEAMNEAPAAVEQPNDAMDIPQPSEDANIHVLHVLPELPDDGDFADAELENSIEPLLDMARVQELQALDTDLGTGTFSNESSDVEVFNVEVPVAGEQDGEGLNAFAVDSFAADDVVVEAAPVADDVVVPDVVEEFEPTVSETAVAQELVADPETQVTFGAVTDNVLDYAELPVAAPPVSDLEPSPDFEPAFDEALLDEVSGDVTADLHKTIEDVPTTAPVELAWQPSELSEFAEQPELAAEVPAEPTPTALRSFDASDASFLLSQLAGEDYDDQAPAPDPEPEPPAAPVEYAPRPRRDDGLTDTAALMRELSSLGAETHSTPPPRPVAPRQSPSQSAAGAQHRKRKGLFGRS